MVGSRSRARTATTRPMVMSGVPPPMVEALGRVRGRRSGTRLWTCCAGRAGTRIRSEAPHQSLTIGRLAAARAGARPYHRLIPQRSSEAWSVERRCWQRLREPQATPLQGCMGGVEIVLGTSCLSEGLGKDSGHGFHRCRGRIFWQKVG
jgi:hypothetical protein